jgi:hypothetical protein
VGRCLKKLILIFSYFFSHFFSDWLNSQPHVHVEKIKSGNDTLSFGTICALQQGLELWLAGKVRGREERGGGRGRRGRRGREKGG